MIIIYKNILDFDIILNNRNVNKVIIILNTLIIYIIIVNLLTYNIIINLQL